MDNDNSHSTNGSSRHYKPSTSSSTLTKRIQNPYSQSSRRKDSDFHYSPLNEPPPSTTTHHRYNGNNNNRPTTTTTSIIETKYKNLHEALHNFCQITTTTDPNNEDLNTSFSTGSTALRQIKLLRKATCELQNAVQWDQKKGDLQSLLMRGTGVYSASSITELPPVTSGLVVTAVDSVIVRLMEEYCNVRIIDSNNATDDPSIKSSRPLWNYRSAVGDHHHPNEAITTALEFLNTAFGCLECHAVFGCLKSEVGCTIETNQESTTIVDALLYFTLSGNDTDDRINRQVLKFQDMDMNESINEERRHKNNQTSKTTSSSSAALFQSNTQLLALCALTKAILCAEFIQTYCTSTTILPSSGIDSVLGEGLGIHIVGIRLQKVATLAAQFLCNDKTTMHSSASPKNTYLSSSSSSSQIMSDDSSSRRRNNSNAAGNNLIAQMACVNLLGALVRTGTNSWIESLLHSLSSTTTTTTSSSLLTNLTNKLAKSIPKFERESLSIGGGGGGGGSHEFMGSQSFNIERYLIHASVTSLFVLVVWNSRMLKLPGSSAVDKKPLVGDEVITKLVSILLAEKNSEADDIVVDPDVTMMDDCDFDYDCIFGSVVQILIHLCITRNEVLKGVLSNHDHNFSSMKGLKCITNFESSQLQMKGKCEGVLLTMIHLNESFRRDSRKLINDSLNQQNLSERDTDEFTEEADCSTGHLQFLEGLFEFAKGPTFSLSILSMVLLRAMVNHDLPCGSFNDVLASKLWQALCGPVDVFELSCHFFRSTLSQAKLTASIEVSSSSISHLPLLCATIDFLAQLTKSVECCEVILDSAFSNGNAGMNCLLSMLDTSTRRSDSLLRNRADSVIIDCSAKENKENTAHFSLSYAVQLGAGTVVGRLCFSCTHNSFEKNEEYNGDKQNSRVSGLALMSRTLKRFATNLAPISMQADQSDESYCGILNLAISQAVSRDLTKRALNLQAILTCIQGDDEVLMATTVFSSACLKRVTYIRSSELESKFEGSMRNLREENRLLSKQLSKEQENLAKVSTFFEQQITFSKVEAKADAVELAEIQAEGKRHAEQRLAQCRDHLINIKDAKNQQKAELQRQRDLANRLKSELAECDHKIKKLENTTKAVQEESMETGRKLISKDNELNEKQSMLKKLKDTLVTEEEKGNVLKEKYLNLKQTNSQTQDNLEDKFCTLISLAQLYESKDKEKKKTEFDLHEKLKATEAYANKAIQKYSRLGERFKDLEKKNYELSHSLEKANQSKVRRESKRRPMGTMEFVNSIHDKSQIKHSVSGKENESSFFSTRNRQNQRSSRKGTYKIVK